MRPWWWGPLMVGAGSMVTFFATYAVLLVDLGNGIYAPPEFTLRRVVLTVVLLLAGAWVTTEAVLPKVVKPVNVNKAALSATSTQAQLQDAAAWRWVRSRATLLTDEDGAACLVAYMEHEELPPDVAAHLEESWYQGPGTEAVVERTVQFALAQDQAGGP